VTPIFLELAEVVEIHRDQIARYGGAEGIRDVGLLQSALAMPAAGAGGEYFHDDLFSMAAAYLFHITKNHPFVDGNKRVGAVAALIFLDLNGIELVAPEEDFEALVTGVADGRIAKAQVAQFLRDHDPSTRSKGRGRTRG
jgi:death-on-curing protein